MKVRDTAICVKFGLVAGMMGLPGQAAAHASQQSFVLLLPTGVYTVAGVAAVALTVLALFAVPDRAIRRLFDWRRMPARKVGRARTVTSLMSFAALASAVWLGIHGPRDPLSNLMPLGFWTMGWMLLVSLTSVFGNLWTWLNPWSGLYKLVGQPTPLLNLPEAFGLWPAVLLLVAFAGYLLAGIAPDDPARLAELVAIYFLVTMAGLLVFGPRWLHQVELGHAIFAAYARLSPWRCVAPAGFGGPGWQVLARKVPRAGGIFALTLLAAGSFDGLNETFWWLGLIGVNPLEFPGRSAVVRQTLGGLACAIVALAMVFAATVWLGSADRARRHRLRTGLRLAGAEPAAHRVCLPRRALPDVVPGQHPVHGGRGDRPSRPWR